MRKAKKIGEILTALGKGTMLTLEILDEMLPNYYRSYGAAQRELHAGTIRVKKDLKETLAKQQFYSLLNQLKRQGLVENKKVDKGTFWKITMAGLQKLKLIQENKIDYTSTSDDKLKIVIYDVPETERQKRLWLSEALEALNFRRLQKSVCIGKSKVPEKFLEDLRKKQILQYVHILEVSKSGTIRELV